MTDELWVSGPDSDSDNCDDDSPIVMLSGYRTVATATNDPPAVSDAVANTDPVYTNDAASATAVTTVVDAGANTEVAARLVDVASTRNRCRGGGPENRRRYRRRSSAG